MAFACNLCHGLLAVSQQLVTTPCGHIYHNTCVTAYFQEKGLETRPICPCCQQELNVETGLISLHPIAYKRNSALSSEGSSVQRTGSGIRNFEQASVTQEVNRDSSSQAFLAAIQRTVLDGVMGMGDQKGNNEGQGEVEGQQNVNVQGRSASTEDKLIDLTGDTPPPSQNPQGGGASLVKMGNDLVFMMDGRVVNMDELLPTTSSKLAQMQRTVSAAADRNDGRSNVRQNIVLPERSLEMSPPSAAPTPVPRRAHEPEPRENVQQRRRSQNELDLYFNRGPVGSLPPPPTASSSMWGIPSWQMGTTWRSPSEGASPRTGINFHRLENVQYYPSPFQRDPVKQQPPFPIQIPLHRPILKSGPSPSALYERLLDGNVPGSTSAKRKASSSEQHGGTRPNLEDVINSTRHPAGTSCTCCPPNEGGGVGHEDPVNEKDEEEDQEQQQQAEWDMTQQCTRDSPN